MIKSATMVFSGSKILYKINGVHDFPVSSSQALQVSTLNSSIYGQDRFEVTQRLVNLYFWLISFYDIIRGNTVVGTDGPPIDAKYQVSSFNPNDNICPNQMDIGSPITRLFCAVFDCTNLNFEVNGIGPSG